MDETPPFRPQDSRSTEQNHKSRPQAVLDTPPPQPNAGLQVAAADRSAEQSRRKDNLEHRSTVATSRRDSDLVLGMSARKQYVGQTRSMTDKVEDQVFFWGVEKGSSRWKEKKRLSSTPKSPGQLLSPRTLSKVYKGDFRSSSSLQIKPFMAPQNEARRSVVLILGFPPASGPPGRPGQGDIEEGNCVCPFSSLR